MRLAAARLAEWQFCPLTTPRPHAGGWALSTCASVLINGRPAVVVTDPAPCLGDTHGNYVASGSAQVAVCSKPAARMSDATFHGGLITFGSMDVLIGGDTVSGFTVAGLRALLCQHDPAFVPQLQASGIPIKILGPGAGYVDKVWNGSAWVDEFVPVEGFGGGQIELTATQSNDAVANTLFHEHFHVSHGHEYSSLNEFETEVASEQWAIDHGLPEGRPGFRKRDAQGRTVVDRDAVKRFVEGVHGPLVVPPTPGGPAPPQPDRVVDHNVTTNNTIMEPPGNRAGRYERLPRVGDRHRVSQVQPYVAELDPSWLTC